VNAARSAYAANWQLTKRWLSRGAGPRGGRREPAEIGQPQFLSVVARLPAQVAEPLAAAARALCSAHPAHHSYPAASIHLTILALAREEGAEDAIGAIAARHRPFAMDARGLNLSTRTVFAELYPRDTELATLRRELRGALVPLHSPASQWLRQRLAHANLVRLHGPVDRRLVGGVGDLRTRDFGRFDVAEIELVRTDKVLSAEGTILLRRFPLGPSPHPG
jgi:2'-5' RNA ligase